MPEELKIEPSGEQERLVLEKERRELEDEEAFKNGVQAKLRSGEYNVAQARAAFEQRAAKQAEAPPPPQPTERAKRPLPFERGTERLRRQFEQKVLGLLPRTGRRRIEQIYSLLERARQFGTTFATDLRQRVEYLLGRAEMPEPVRQKVETREAVEQPEEKDLTKLTTEEARDESFRRFDSLKAYVEDLAERKPENLERVDKVYNLLLKTTSTKFEKWKELASIGLSAAALVTLPLGGSALLRTARMAFGSLNYSTIGFRMGSEWGLGGRVREAQQRYQALKDWKAGVSPAELPEETIGEMIALYRAGVRLDRYESNRQGLKLFGKAGEVFQALRQGRLFESGRTFWEAVREDKKEFLKIGGKVLLYSTPLLVAPLSPALAMGLYAGTTAANMVERIMRYRQLGAKERAEWERKEPDSLLKQITELADRYEQHIAALAASRGYSQEEIQQSTKTAQSELSQFTDRNYLELQRSRGSTGLKIGAILGAISASFYGIISQRAPAEAARPRGAGAAAGALTPREGAPAPAPETAPRGFGPPVEGAPAPPPGEPRAPAPGGVPSAPGPEQYGAPGPGKAPGAPPPVTRFGPPAEGAPAPPPGEGIRAPAPGGIAAPPPGEGVPAGPPGTGERVGTPSERYPLSTPEGGKPIALSDEFKKPYELKGKSFVNIDIDGDGTFDRNERCEVIDGKYYKLLYADQNGDGVAEKLPQGHYLKVDLKTGMAYEYDTRGTKVSDEVWQVADKDDYMRRVAGTESWDKTRAEHADNSIKVGDHYETKGWGTVARRGIIVDLNALEGNPDASIIDKIPELQARIVNGELIGNFHGVEIHFTGEAAGNLDVLAGAEVNRQALEQSVFRFEPSNLKISRLEFPATMSTESVVNLMIQHRSELPPSLRALMVSAESTNPITGETNRTALLRWLGEARATEGGVSELTLEKLNDIRTNHSFEVARGSERYVVIEGATIRDAKLTVTRELVERYKGQVVPIEQLTQPGAKPPGPQLAPPPTYGLSTGPDRFQQ